MYWRHESARLDGIRLLEAHVKLLREARAALRGHPTTSATTTATATTITTNSNDRRRGVTKLYDEIEKVEQKLQTWRKTYEEQYLQGCSIWDIIRKEEARQNTETERQPEDKQKEDKSCLADNNSKELQSEKQKATNCNSLAKTSEKTTVALEEKQMKEENETTISSTKPLKNVEEVKEKKNTKEIINKMSDMKVCAKTEATLETPPLPEDNNKSQKRPLEDTDEDETNVKKRKIASPDKTMPKQVEGHRVLVQNLPLSLLYTELRSYFMQFGNVTKVFLKTGGGCGYIIYDSEATADHVCSLQHRFSDQEVRVVKDTPRAAPLLCPEPTNQDFEVFVFGVPPGTDSEMLRSSLSTFGSVKKVTQPTRKPYAFVGFESENGKEAALQARSVTVNNKTVFIRQTRGYSEEGASQEKVTKEISSPIEERPEKGYQVFVFGINIPLDLHGFQLGLAKFGKVVSAYMPEDKNYAFVGFETEESQRAALEAGAVILPYGRALIKPVSRR